MTADQQGREHSGAEHRHQPGRALPAAAQSFQGRTAGIVSRCLAAGVNLAMVALLVAAVYFGIAGLKLMWDPKNASLPSFPRAVAVTAGAVIAVLYLTASWSTSGRSAGDQLLGLRVEGARGDRLHVVRSFVRALICVLLPIGLLLAAVDRTRRSLADLVVGSIVVYDWSSRALEDED